MMIAAAAEEEEKEKEALYGICFYTKRAAWLAVCVGPFEGTFTFRFMYQYI